MAGFYFLCYLPVWTEFAKEHIFERSFKFMWFGFTFGLCWSSHLSQLVVENLSSATTWTALSAVVLLKISFKI